jgi:hypothetical protein
MAVEDSCEDNQFDVTSAILTAHQRYLSLSPFDFFLIGVISFSNPFVKCVKFFLANRRERTNVNKTGAKPQG